MCFINVLLMLASDACRLFLAHKKVCIVCLCLSYSLGPSYQQLVYFGVLSKLTVSRMVEDKFAGEMEIILHSFKNVF